MAARLDRRAGDLLPGGPGLLERPRDFFLAVALDHVADLDVVEVLDADAALVAFLHFLHVVLEAAQRRDGARVDLDADRE